MVMRPDPRAGALTAVRPFRLGPWWLWTIVAMLAGIAAYAGYIARSSNERLAGIDAARMELAAGNDRLKEELAEAKRQLDQATAGESKSRTDAAAISGLFAKLEKRRDDLQSNLAAVRATAEKTKAEVEQLRPRAARAEAARAQVRLLRERNASLKGDIKIARGEASERLKAVERLKAEAASAAEAKAALERELAGLKKQIGEMQQKLDATPTAPVRPAR